MAKTELTPKYDETEKFLACFEGNLQLFSKSESGMLSFPMDFKRAKNVLTKNNAAGQDIYVTINECKKGAKRRKEDFLRVRAVFLDDDGDDKGVTDPNSFPIPPNIVVHTSPGKTHYYWLTDHDDGDEFEEVQHRIAIEYHGDTAVEDRTRIMRLPGFVHTDSGQLVTCTISGEPYEWGEIVNAFPPLKKEVATKSENSGRGKPALDIYEAGKSIISAEEIYPSVMPMALSMVNKGLPPKDVKALCLAFLHVGKESNPSEAARYDKAINEVDNFVDDAIGKINKERAKQYVDEDVGSPFTCLNWPPGRVGTVAKWIYSCMHHPSSGIAIATAFHLVSVVGGGCYHWKGSPVSRARTILADSGRGKQTASDCIDSVLHKILVVNTVDNFVMKEAHSPFNYQADLNKHRVRGMVNNEAGLLQGSKVGNMGGKAAWKLQTLATQFGGAPTSVVDMSRAKGTQLVEATEPVYCPVFVLLDESTPETYLPNAIKDLHVENGSLARSELFFIEPEEYYNEDAHENKVNIPAEIIELCTALVNQFNETESAIGVSPAVYEKMIAMDDSLVLDEMLKLSHEQVQQRKDSAGDALARSQITRFIEKVKTTAMILAIADGCDVTRTKPTSPCITREHLEYAIEYHEELTRAVIANSKKGHMASLTERAVQRLLTCLKDKNDTDSMHLGKDGEITHGWLARKFRSSDSIIRGLEQQYHCKPKQARYMIMDEAVVKGMVAPSGRDKWINLVKDI